MICVIQRVKSASVKTKNFYNQIKKGLLVLIGIGKGDSKKDVVSLVNKIINLRIFEDNLSKMNLSLIDIVGEVLVVSQFTLLADCRKGRRPSFTNSATPEEAKYLYEMFVEEIKKFNIETKTGVFGANMDIELVNEGPVTIVLNSKEIKE